MGYEHSTTSTKKLLGLALALLFHVLLISGLMSGLATDLVQKVQRTVNVAIVPEAKPPPPPPEPEPEPEDAPEQEPQPKVVKREVRKPKAYVPPVETAVRRDETAALNAIASVTTSEPTAPVLSPPPPRPRRAVVRRARLRPGCKLPRYPARSLDRGEEGALELRFLIGADGSVKQSKLVKSSGHGRLDKAARKAFEKCKFVPVTVNGVTKPAWVSQPFEWRLQQR